MSDFQLQDLGNGNFSLSGEMSFANADRILREASQVFASHDEVVLDLSKIGKADSAGLALLLEWKAEARRRQTCIRFTGVPEGLAAIARTTGVDRFVQAAG